MLFMNRLKFSCFSDFFDRIFKTRKEYTIIRQWKGLGIVWSKMKRHESFVKLMSKNSISEYGFFPISDHDPDSGCRGQKSTGSRIRIHKLISTCELGCVTQIMKKECACQDQEEEEEGGMDLYSSHVQAV
jgi:hypothetical protein